MPIKRIVSIALGLFLSLGALLYFQKQSGSVSNIPASDGVETNHQERNSTSTSHSLRSDSKGIAPASTSQSGQVTSSNAHELNESNLDDVVGRCFQGEPCELKEDAWQLYLKLKSAGRGKATDALISYLRRELKNPSRRNQYKDVLLKMIDDYYPPRILEFQHAAYYYYLGDLNTSLDIYLRMEKAAARDANAFNPPKLNIANDFYELHRWKEALAYYKKALDEELSEDSRGPDQQMSIHFIQDRISKLERN
jgi:tetratricopeptide (TPR) repeat protein